MKTFFSLISALLLFTLVSSAQTNTRTSSKSAAQYDAASIDANISNNKDVLYFSQLAIDRGSNSETKEAAQDMLADFTGLLYSMEQLAVAGGNQEKTSNIAADEAKSLNQSLAVTRGFDFDTSWIAGVLRMHQAKLNDLAEQKTTATNERLKAAVTEAIPVVRRYISKLTSLQKRLIKQDQLEKREAAKRQK